MAVQSAKDSAAWVVRVGSIAAVPDVLRELGFDPDKVLSDGGFSPRLLDNPENVVSVAARGQLIAHCAAVTHCEHFGLLLGQCNGLHSLGLVGLLARYSEDVQTALSNLIRYFHLHVRGAAMSLAVHEDTAILGHQLYDSGTAAYNHICDAAAAWLLNIMHELCGHKLKPLTILLNHRRPADIRPFRKFFQVPVEFNAGRNAVVFPASWLEMGMPNVHADMRRLVQSQIDAVAVRLSEDFPEQIRAVLHDSLLSGHADLNHLSALFALHPRTLRRRLEAAGSSYQKLLDEIRFDLARQMLSNSELGVGEIALMLQYCDSRSFIRAFRRWSGETPARWREVTRKLPYTGAG